MSESTTIQVNIQNEAKPAEAKPEKKHNKKPVSCYRRDLQTAIQPHELEMHIEGCVCKIRVKESPYTSHIKQQQILSAPAISVLTNIKISLESKFTEFNNEFYLSLLNLSLDLYRDLSTTDREFIYKAITLLNCESKNIFISSIMKKLRDEYADEINRLKLLQGSIEAGHSNSEILDEYLKLVQRLVKLRLIPSNYAKTLVRKITEMFLNNVKSDISAKKMNAARK